MNDLNKYESIISIGWNFIIYYGNQSEMTEPVVPLILLAFYLILAGNNLGILIGGVASNINIYYKWTIRICRHRVQRDRDAVYL